MAASTTTFDPQELMLLGNWDLNVTKDASQERYPPRTVQELHSVVKRLFSNTHVYNDPPKIVPVDILSVVRGLHGLYIQENYTGPPLSWEGELVELSSKVEDFVQERWKKIQDGEALVENMSRVNLVLNAGYLLQRLNSVSDGSFGMHPCPTVHWWRIRNYFLHQRFLEEKSAFLWRLIREEILQFEPVATPEALSPELAALYYAELVEIYSFYYDMETAKTYLAKGKETIGLSTSTTGVLGKRTKFQQTKIAQLVLKVEVEDKGIQHSVSQGVISSLPSAVALDDEDRLDKLQLAEDLDTTAADLSSVQHLLILTDFSLLRKYLPHDGVYLEELLAYLNFLIEHPKEWGIQMVALLQRSVLEIHNRRTVERSMKQLEVLHKTVTQNSPESFYRLRYFYGTGMPAKWEIDMSLAQVLTALHLFKEALNIYLRLNSWEDVISCYTHLNLRHKAEQVILEQLETSPSVKLWILLGDATDNSQNYETAWKLSEGKSARAQRQWGYFYFVRKQYAEAIPHLQKSLELNPLENPAWIRLGYASLVTEDWSTSTRAYQHSSTLDGDNFEIWNNLAHGFVKLGEKKKALRALKEASKCNYENWKVWENTLVVATDCKAFDEVIRAYNRLLDLKGKWADEEVLALLVKAVLTNMNDAADQPCHVRYYKESLKLFGRITSLVTNNPKIWKLYSDLYFVEESDSDPYLTWTKSLTYIQKSIEYILSDVNLGIVEGVRAEAVDFTVEYIKRVKELQSKYPDTSGAAVTSAVFTVRRVYGAIKKRRDSAIVTEGFEKHLTEIKSTAELLNIQL